MARPDQPVQVIQVQTALADLANKLDMLPEVYRETIIPNLEKLIQSVDHLTETASGAADGPSTDARSTDAPSTDAARIEAVHIYTDLPVDEVDLTALIPELAVKPAPEEPSEALNNLLKQSLDNEQLFSQFQDGVIYHWDLKTDQVVRSAGLEQLIGIPPDQTEKIARWWINRVAPDDLKRVDALTQEIRLGRRATYQIIYRIKLGDGKWLKVKDRGYTIYDDQGRPLRVVGLVIRDEEAAEERWARTDRNNNLMKTRMRLLESEEISQLTLSLAPVAVFGVNEALVYTQYSSQNLRLPASRFIGHRDDELLPREQAAELMAMKRSVLESGQAETREMKLTFDEEERVFMVGLKRTSAQSLGEDALLGVFYEITRQRELEVHDAEASFKLDVSRLLLEQRELERQKLAYLIHEGPIQSLASLGFTAKLARDICPPEAQAEAQVLEHINDQVKDLIGELRWVINDLRPPGLMRFGLCKAIQSHADELAKKEPGFSISLDLAAACNGIPQMTGLVLYRIYQESLNNILRHAQAARVEISLVFEPTRLVFEIHDNGVGFTPYPDWVRYSRQGHYGLVSMRERAESIGGRLKVKSQPGGGTTIRVTVPLKALEG